MKKIIIISGMMCIFAGISTANAQISINFGEPEPSYVKRHVYVAPAPIYPTYAVERGRIHDRRFVRRDIHREPIRRDDHHR